MESSDSIADKLKLKLLLATSLGIAQLPKYRSGAEESLQRVSEDGAVHEQEVRLTVNLFGDTARTTRRVEEVERALPGGHMTPAANGEGFSLRVSAKRRDEAMALTEAILTRHGFYVSRTNDAPSSGSSPIK